MGHSNFIAAAIAIAFLIFITAKGSLAKYIAMFTGSAGTGSDTTNTAGATNADAAPAGTAQSESGDAFANGSSGGGAAGGGGGGDAAAPAAGPLDISGGLIDGLQHNVEKYATDVIKDAGGSLLKSVGFF